MRLIAIERLRLNRNILRNQYLGEIPQICKGFRNLVVREMLEHLANQA